jgi:hypothetical protein
MYKNKYVHFKLEYEDFPNAFFEILNISLVLMFIYWT